MAFDCEIAMAQATADATSFLVLRDVHEGPLLDWILSSGFTQEEIALVQEPYFFQEVQEEQLSRQREMQRSATKP